MSPWKRKTKTTICSKSFLFKPKHESSLCLTVFAITQRGGREVERSQRYCSSNWDLSKLEKVTTTFTTKVSIRCQQRMAVPTDMKRPNVPPPCSIPLPTVEKSSRPRRPNLQKKCWWKQYGFLRLKSDPNLTRTQISQLSIKCFYTYSIYKCFLKKTWI